MSGHDLTLELSDHARQLVPDTLSASKLAEVLKLYEQAVLAAMPEPPDADAPAVSLKGIRDGSVKLEAKHGLAALAAAAALKLAVQTNDYSRIPYKSQEKLAELSRLVVSNRWVATFSGLTPGVAEISADRPVKEARKVRVRNNAVIYGECEKVGGQRPKASIRLFSTGKQIDVDVSPELARELGQRLYDYVGVEGRALYDLTSDEIVSFEGVALVPYRGKKADPVGALRRIAALSGDTWKGVDPGEYVRTLRDEE